MVPSFLKIKHETEQEFKKIATELINGWAIKNHESLYRMTDLEVYWTSPTHIDNSVYKRKHTDPTHGDWFFHYSGVDITLKDDTVGGYGGILIRGIYSLAEQKQYEGPLVSMMKLFSGRNAFIDPINTRIVKHDFSRYIVQSRSRKGLGQNAMVNGADKLRYRFFIDLKKSKSL